MGRRGCDRDLFVLSDSSSNSIAGRHRSLHTKSDVVLKRNASNAHVDGFAGKSPQLMKELWRKRNLIGLHNKRTIIKKFVGADAHIGPEADGMGVSVLSDRSGNIPRGAMRASPPTLKTNVDFVGNAPNAENARCFCGHRPQR